MRRPALLALALTCVACDDEPPMTDAGPPMTDAGPGVELPDTLGSTERPARLVVPGGYTGLEARPVVILLHGYGASGNAQAQYFQIEREAQRRDWLLVLPDGTVDASGRQFWNATPACCDFGPTGVDDVGYLIGLVDELEALVPLSDVYFIGHSNGGFMSYRMACEHADRVSAIMSLAGSDFNEATDCVPSEPVSVLQVHGDMDTTIPYEGSATRGFPSADEAARRWAERASCDTSMPTMGAPLDLEQGIDGAETTVLSYEAGCVGAEAALWTIVDGGHIPGVTRGFIGQVFDWLEAHAR